MEVLFLGTGGIYPTEHRGLPAVALRYQGEVLLFDCGEGTQRQLISSPYSYQKVKAIFFTHLHADHYLGLPGLLQTMNLNERKEDLLVVGPEPLEERMELFRKAGLLHLGFRLDVRQLDPGEELRFRRYTVRCIEADHRCPAVSYIFTEHDRPGKFDAEKAEALGLSEKGPTARLRGQLARGESVEYEGRVITPEEIVGPPRRGFKVVISGDTRPLKELVEEGRDCDLLVHEGSFTEEDAERAEETRHSTTSQAAKVGKEMGAKRVYINHISPRYINIRDLLAEARRHFPTARIARDLELVRLDYEER